MERERRAVYHYVIADKKGNTLRRFETPVCKTSAAARKYAYRWLTQWLKLKGSVKRRDVRLVCGMRTLAIGVVEYLSHCNHCQMHHWCLYQGRTVCPRCNEQEYEQLQRPLDKLERGLFPATSQLSLHLD